VKFTDQGEVVLSITTPADGGGPGGIEVAVRDTGIGIAPAAREWLFKPFSQADSSTTRKYGGTGLGLVICQRLIQLMGGSIGFDSAPGQGTVFTCRIPLTAAPDAVRESPHAGLAGRHVLVIASSHAARRALREQVIGWGMSCAEADGIAEVPGLAAVKRPAVVIVDHDLPGGGLALGRQLAGDAATSGIPIVLLVGGAHRGMATAAKEAGIVGFLTKPVRHAQLFECLLVVLDQACRLQDRAMVSQPLLVTRHSLEEEREARRVLVVEDNAINRQVAVMMLNKAGCRCDIATNGQEAIEALGRHDYQVVFMDCQMPVLDGFAATMEIRRRGQGGRRVHIIALTANAMASDRDRCLAAGMDDYLCKPLKPAELQAALARADQRLAASAAPMPVEVASQEPVVDDAVLQALLAATDAETLKAVAMMTRTDAAIALTELRTAVRAGDAVSLGRTAHRLRGSSATLGLRRVQSCCQVLEKAVRDRQVAQAASLVETLDRTLAETLPVLARHPLVAGG
jgi:two-component system, sensor histidine kinase and response regulator